MIMCVIVRMIMWMTMITSIMMVMFMGMIVVIIMTMTVGMLMRVIVRMIMQKTNFLRFLCFVFRCICSILFFGFLTGVISFCLKEMIMGYKVS